MDAKNIHGIILVLHGADDAHVKPEEVGGFEVKKRDVKVDWQLVCYGNAVHSFTDIGAGSDNSKGVAYSEKSDQRSWSPMKTFFSETLK